MPSSKLLKVQDQLVCVGYVAVPAVAVGHVKMTSAVSELLVPVMV